MQQHYASWKSVHDLPEAIRHHVDELLKCRIDGQLLCELFNLAPHCSTCSTEKVSLGTQCCPTQIDTELNDIDEKFDFRNTNDEDYIEYETKDKKDFFMTTASPPRSGQTQTLNVSIANNGELGQVKQ